MLSLTLILVNLVPEGVSRGIPASSSLDVEKVDQELPLTNSLSRTTSVYMTLEEQKELKPKRRTLVPINKNNLIQSTSLKPLIMAHTNIELVPHWETTHLAEAGIPLQECTRNHHKWKAWEYVTVASTNCPDLDLLWEQLTALVSIDHLPSLSSSMRSLKGMSLEHKNLLWLESNKKLFKASLLLLTEWNNKNSLKSWKITFSWRENWRLNVSRCLLKQILIFLMPTRSLILEAREM